MPIHSKLLIRSLALALILALAHVPISALAVDTVTICGETVPLDTRELYLRRKDTGDLSPLADLKQLCLLILEDVPTDDLSPLAALPLEIVALSGTQVSDLTPLSSLRGLRELFLVDCPVADLVPIASLRELASLNLVGTLVTDLAVPAALPKLERLYVGGEIAPPLTPVRNSGTLRSLFLIGEGYNPLPMDDIPPVTTLGIQRSAISDLSVLRLLSGTLSSLDLEDTQVVDLSPIAGMKISSLTLSHCPVNDLTPLADVPMLERLYLQSLPAFADVGALLSPLRSNAALRYLSISDGGAISMDAVASSVPSLSRLHLWSCAPERLGALAEMDYLSSLELYGCTLTSPEELAEMHRLWSLALHGCTGITQSQMDALQEALPTCTISYRESLHGPVYLTLLDALPDTLYYNSQGGRFFHFDTECPSVASKYLPLKPLEKARINDSPFYHLTPCSRCVDYRK